MSNREHKKVLRMELASWQRSAVILAVLMIIFALMAWRIVDQHEDREITMEVEIARLSAECENAKKIQQDAVEQLGAQVQAYDRLVDAIEMQEQRELQQMRDYEALGMYQYIGICTLTAYCCESKGNPHICGTGTGLTASGLPVAPGMVAVDPSIIPLGSTVIINGISYLAADTGVTGYHIDIAIQTHEEADAFGVSSAEVWIIPPGGGTDGK